MSSDLKHPFVHSVQGPAGSSVTYDQADRLRIIKSLEAHGDYIGLRRILLSPDRFRLQKAVKDRAQSAIRRLERKVKA